LPSLHIHTRPLFQVELEKTVGSRWTCFGVRLPRTLDYPTINLNPRHIAPYDHNARLSQMDRWIDEHHSNRATIRSNERIAC